MSASNPRGLAPSSALRAHHAHTADPRRPQHRHHTRRRSGARASRRETHSSAALLSGGLSARAHSCAWELSARLGRCVAATPAQSARLSARSSAAPHRGAKSRFEASLAVREKLAAANPGSAEAQRDLWVSMWRIAKNGQGVHWSHVLQRMEAMAAGGVLSRRTKNSWLRREFSPPLKLTAHRYRDAGEALVLAVRLVADAGGFLALDIGEGSLHAVALPGHASGQIADFDLILHRE